MHKQFTLLFSLASIFIIAQPTTWNSRGVGGGGALYSPSINPSNTNEYYIACDMSELFHTTNYGLGYSQVHFTQLVAGHNSKVCYTSTSGLLYSVNYANDMSVPVKSTDGGITWAALTGNPDNTEETFTIHADYNNPNRVIISYYGGIYISQNGGNTFTQFHTAATGAGNVVGGIFFDGNTIYVGTNDGVLVSVNGGSTWSTATITGLPSNYRIWSFAAGKVGNTTRLFCIVADVNDIYVGLQGSDYYNFPKGIYTCDYGVTNWTSCSTGINFSTQFPMYVDMAENTITTVYLAGSNSIAEPIILKTTNAGGNWANTFITANNQNIATGWSGQGGDRGWSYGECPFGFDVAATNSNFVVFGDFGFVHKTANGGTSWQQAYVDVADQHPANATTPPNQSYHSVGIENTTCWQVHWSNTQNMFACFSDIKGIRSTDGGSTWSFNYTGHNANSMYRVVQHPQNGTLFAGTSNIHDIYQSTYLTDARLDVNDVNGKIIYSTNNGATWQDLHIFNHPVFWIALDPNNPNRAYASVIHYNNGSGVGGVYICNDLQNLASSTWTLLPNPPRTEKHPACLVVLNDGNLIATYSGRRANNAFTASSGCFIYNPSNNSWTDVSDPGMFYWTKDIVVDPNDAQQNTWYVGVFSGWGGPPNGLGGLYKTTNRGQTWTRISNVDRVTSCTFNPANANQIYMTSEQNGLFICNNVNAGNPTFSLVNSYPFKQPERVFFNPNNANEVWVTSFGNGMKMGSLTTTGEFEFIDNELFTVFPNPTQGVFSVQLTETKNVFNCTVINALGDKVYENKISTQNFTIDLSAYDAGLYYLLINSNKKIVSKKIILIK